MTTANITTITGTNIITVLLPALLPAVFDTVWAPAVVKVRIFSFPKETPLLDFNSGAIFILYVTPGFNTLSGISATSFFLSGSLH